MFQTSKAAHHLFMKEMSFTVGHKFRIYFTLVDAEGDLFIFPATTVSLRDRQAGIIRIVMRQILPFPTFFLSPFQSCGMN